MKYCPLGRGLSSLLPPRFDGNTYDLRFDGDRLTKQYVRVFDFMSDGRWRTLDEIALGTGYIQQSISARLRDMRKLKNGSHTVDRRRRGDSARGVFEYRLIVKRAA